MSHEYLRLVMEVTEYCGGITESQKDRLLEILEKATREEYRKRAFKKRFKFHPFEGEPNRGTIEIDGDIYRVDIGKSEKAITGPTGVERKVNRCQSCYLSGGDIVLDSDIIMKLKNDKRIDGTLYHEVGHIKYQGIKLDRNENGDWLLSGIDKSLSPKVIEVILDKVISEIYERIPDRYLRNDPHAKERINGLRAAYIAKMKSNPDRDINLQQFREDAINVYKKFDKGGHTNWAEFEADRYAANKIGDQELIKALEEYDKKYLARKFKAAGINPDRERKRPLKYDKQGIPIYCDDKQRQYYEIKQRHMNNITDDIAERKKVLYNSELKKYKDIYK